MKKFIYAITFLVAIIPTQIIFLILTPIAIIGAIAKGVMGGLNEFLQMLEDGMRGKL